MKRLKTLLLALLLVAMMAAGARADELTCTGSETDPVTGATTYHFSNGSKTVSQETTLGRYSTYYRPDGTRVETFLGRPDGTVLWTQYAADGLTITGQTRLNADGTYDSRPFRDGRPAAWHPGPIPGVPSRGGRVLLEKGSLSWGTSGEPPGETWVQSPAVHPVLGEAYSCSQR